MCTFINLFTNFRLGDSVLIWFAFPNQMYLPLFSVQETMANFKMLKGNFCQSILAEYGPVNVTSEILMHV